MHEFMQPILNTLDEQPKADAFCLNLKNRAGLIADHGQTDYIFRHKSFREFMAGLQILKESVKSEERLATLISHFTEDWWEESLRFLISRSDNQIFNQFS